MSKQVAVLGIDLGKNSCSVAGLDAGGAVVLRRQPRREVAIALAAGLPPCVVAMEACCGTHHAARLQAAQGHEVRLMAFEYVRFYVKAQKNVWPTPSASGLATRLGTVCSNVSGSRAKPSATMEVRAARSARANSVASNGSPESTRGGSRHGRVAASKHSRVLLLPTVGAGDAQRC